MKIQTHVKNCNLLVSTVRLPMDHGYDGLPLWYETMVFPTDGSGNVTSWSELHSDRYTTAEEAEEGHGKVVALAALGALTLIGAYD